MISTVKQPASATSATDALSVARAACRRIAPLWPLQNFVAVNPFLGLSEIVFVEACHLMRKIAPGGMQMPLTYYAEKYQLAEIQSGDLAAALDHANQFLPPVWSTEAATLTPAELVEALAQAEEEFHDIEILTIADALDRSSGSRWNSEIIEVISQFCASYYDRGQSAWKQPWSDQPLYTAWRAMAMLDAKPEFQGLPGFRQHVRSLPENAEEAITAALATLEIREEEAAVDFLHRQLMSIRGWAGYVQYLVREKEMAGGKDDSLLQLLAIRLAYETALLAQFESPTLREFWSSDPANESPPSRPVLIRFLWQLAHENAWQRQLFERLTERPSNSVSRPATQALSRPATQAVFCIDVRSEVFRRGLESANPEIQTIGFAGFFGMAIEYLPFGEQQGQTQCPVLLKPAYRIPEIPARADQAAVEEARKNHRLGKRLRHSWNSFKTSAISGFSFVETAGLLFAPKLFKSTFAQGSSSTCQHQDHFEPSLDPSRNGTDGIPLADRINLATGALSHMGLRKNFARLVLICGHGSETTNNPYGAGLDCGACGGHAGNANARVATAILNDPEVRSALNEKGIEIPDDTHFLAGLHNTTTDDVVLYDRASVPAGHRADLEALEKALAAAGKKARRERAVALGLSPDVPNLDQKIRSKARDWAEVRPEWGLAGNAAFIAAPRKRTKDTALNGRVFLHDYDHAKDEGEATLELILTAPMVVGSWINLQYYASTVNNEVFGSGNKVTHNVTGTLGVCQGNVGDLQTGLPMQSLHDGQRWIHEPLRLHVMVEAPRESLIAILDKHPDVRKLVTNGWVLLFAIENEGKTILPVT